MTLLLIVSMVFVMTACKSKDEASILIYDGQFSEMRIIHQMVKLLVEEKTDIKVTIGEEMTPVNTYNELTKERCDLFNSYDGTLLTTYLKQDVSDVTEGMTLYDYANEQAMAKDGTRLLAQLGTDNTYAIGVTKEVAQEYGVTTISGLVPVADELIFGAEHEFFSEEGSMKFNPLSEFYGLEFKEVKPVDIGLKYSAVENGMLDVTIVYTTDGLNKKAGLIVLEDDREYFPDYNGALLVRDNLFEELADVEPDLEEILNELGGTMNNAMMTDMTYDVDVNGKTPKEVAEKFLKDVGLIS
ncbi:MAG: glycine/betaine ABC transporter substrate-binding protein [Anaerolineaceae bacterium]|nr:MAG: glycine/betaine ABC transporter substrate-binding protein [Anaerolineaceae bacterium]